MTADFNGDGVPDLAAADLTQAAVAIFLGGTVTTGKLLNVPVIGLNQAIQSTYTPNLGFYTGSLSNQVIINGGGQVPTMTTVALTMGTNPSSLRPAAHFYSDGNGERWRQPHRNRELHR